ncbi:MAG TPA: ABC transporter permease [Chryseolinea sp.]|nr:ABC transporter permease [Chryseolinea sp.]
MLANYFITALRHLRRFKLYTFINLFGLTLGMAASLVITVYIQNELSYDRFNEHADRIARLEWEVKLGETITHNAAVPPPIAEAIERDFPEVEVAARFRDQGSFEFKRNTENIIVSDVVYADNDIFRIFTIPFLAGSPDVALKDAHSLVITESCARRFYPDGDALGKALVMDNRTLYTITGVIRDLPTTCHFRYDIFLSMEGLDEARNGNWIGGPFNTYVLLREGNQLENFREKLPNIVTQYILPHATSVLGASFVDKFKQETGNYLRLHATPLTDIHLHSHLRNELQANGDVKYVVIMAIIGGFILIIASLNFMNLSTARSVKRAREMGVRKVLGSTKAHLMLQFLVESVALCLLSFLLALVVTELFLPLFNSVAGQRLSVPYANLYLMGAFIGLSVLTGILSGIYPGLILASFKPADTLKGKISAAGQSSSHVYSSLVVVQFAISIFLTVATLAVYQQFKYMNEADLGFSQEQVVRLKGVQHIGDRAFALKQALLRQPHIRHVTVSSYFPGPGSARKTPLAWKQGSLPLPEHSVNVEQWSVDADYANALGMKIVAGRNFTAGSVADSTSVILNQTALKMLSFEGDPVGQQISLFAQQADGTQQREATETYTVIGVVEDFNFESLRQSITPLGLFLGKSTGSIAIRYETGHSQEVIAGLQKAWREFAPGEPFDYSFMNEDLERMFLNEKHLGQVFIAFTVLAILIACLGLFALTSFTAEQRTREIGIRKVLGATTSHIAWLLSASFGKLILASFFVAVPLAALSVRWYLQQYAYRAEIGVTTYVEAGLLAFLLAGVTMGYHCLQSAAANPVQSLKHD